MKIAAIALALLMLLTGCSGPKEEKEMYIQISQEEAKKMMDEQSVIVVDVREQSEYEQGHIPGALLLPLGTISDKTAAEVIPNKEEIALIYCRSGRRSKMAAEMLSGLGYTNLYEFGGIITWPYEIE